MRFRLLLVVVAGLVGFGACSSSSNSAQEVFTSPFFNFKPGHPETRISAIGLYDETGESGINIDVEVVFGSLVYRKNATLGMFEAIYTVEIDLIGIGEKNPGKLSFSLADTIRAKTDHVVYSQDVHTFHRRFLAPAGDYQVLVNVIDQNSETGTLQRTVTSIPAMQDDVLDLTDIFLLARDLDKENSPFLVATTYDIAGRNDSLKFQYQVTKTSSDKRVVIDMSLVKFKSDSLVARELYSPDYAQGSIGYRGIDRRKNYEIQTSRRVLTSEIGSILVEFSTPMLDRGNYRFEVAITDEASGVTIRKARDFGIRSENYPSLKTPKELAAPLRYLMDDREYKNLMALEDDDDIKRAMDRFWLSHLKNRNIAGQVVEMYYTRVEEANKQFSTFKEGWKTDAGMVYILYGRPWYVEQTSRRLRWVYGYNQFDARRVFEFFQPRFQNADFPFLHFVAFRRNSYFQPIHQARAEWLNGTVLSRDL